MSKFIVASRQATQLDKVGILLETRIQEVKDDWKGWAEMVAKAMDEAKEMQNLVEELTANIVEKDSCLDHLQKKNDELSTLIKKAKRMLLWSSKLPNSILIFRHKLCAGFQNFRMGVLRNASQKLTLVPSSSILVLRAPFSKQALKMSTLKMMPLPSLLKMIPPLEITLNEGRLKYHCNKRFFFFFWWSIVLDHLNLSKYISLIFNPLGRAFK